LDESGKAIGTGFLIHEQHDAFRAYYVATADHVARQARAIRHHFFLFQSEPVEGEVLAWFFPETDADVALAPIHLSGSSIASLPTDIFADKDTQERLFSLGNPLALSRRDPQMGDRVYFAGLLGRIPGMLQAIIPMVRSGVLGALYQERVPVVLPGNTHIILREPVHLIDCHSFGGFSGSPCFIQFEQEIRNVRDGYVEKTVQTTLLLGLVSAHFDSVGVATTTGEFTTLAGDITVPINAGIAIVTPSDALRELLESDGELVAAQRKLRDGWQ